MLGIVGLVGLALCFLGVLPAVVGLVLGTVALVRRDADRRPAVVGVVCSALALVIGAGSLLWLLSKAARCGDEARYPDEPSRRGCVEREFPFAKTDVHSDDVHSDSARTASSLSGDAYTRKSSMRPPNPGLVGSLPR